jgi:F-type H+-transporting ATPase subunit delta
MAESVTAARPYAQAAFDVARQAGKLKNWSEWLAAAAALVSEAEVRGLIGNPRVPKAQVQGFMLDALGGALDQHGKNFIRLLAENQRLALLPEIAALFEASRAEAEGRLRVQVTSAAALSDEQRGLLAAALKKRFQREVELYCDTDKSLIGGAIIRAGDRVIDGSARGKLQRLAQALKT